MSALKEIITVPGHVAMDEMVRLLADKPNTGLHPVLFGSKIHADSMAENCLRVRDAKKVLSESYRIDVLKSIAECKKQKRAEEKWIMQDVGSAEDKEESDRHASLDLECAKEMNEKYEKQWIDVIHIGLMEVEQPWQIFAHFRWESDGWGNAIKCAIHRHWQNQWGAEAIALQETITECFVKHPPSARRDAMKLAHEQYYYCSDIVHQGAGSIQELASELLNCKQWFFWWD